MQHSNGVTHSLQSSYLTFRVAAALGCIRFVFVFSLCGRLSVQVVGRSAMLSCCGFTKRVSYTPETRSTSYQIYKHERCRMHDFCTP